MKRGFSIIELIVACLILGIMATIGLNAYIGLRDKSITKTAEARLHQLNIAKGQFIAEYGRLEAQNIWTSLPSSVVTVIPGQDNTDNEKRYNLLKRYIERPQATLKEFMPAGCTLTTPTNVHATYTGTDNQKKPLTPAP